MFRYHPTPSLSPGAAQDQAGLPDGPPRSELLMPPQRVSAEPLVNVNDIHVQHGCTLIRIFIIYCVYKHQEGTSKEGHIELID